MESHEDSSQFPPVPSAAIAAMILHDALDGDSELYEYSPAKRTPDSIRDFVIDYLRKNAGEEESKLSNVRPYLREIWRSIFLEIQDLLTPREPNGEPTRINRMGQLVDDEHEVELLSTGADSKEIRIRKKLLSVTHAPPDRVIYD